MKINYETDVVAWAHEQAKLLRSGQLSVLDVEHLAEEIESMSASERRELRNRLKVLLQHLLKWEFQPERRCSGWQATMLEQRDSIEEVLKDSPSLRATMPENLALAYPSAVRFASKETSLSARLFPKQCPYTLANVMTDDWLPPDAG
jgi:Domain of unknown function DUF29